MRLLLKFQPLYCLTPASIDDAALTPTYHVQHPYATQPQMPHEIQDNHGHTLNPVESVNRVNSYGQSAGETANWKGDFDFMQGTEIDIALASMNLDDGSPTQSAPVRTSLDPPCIVDQDASASAARNACIVLKTELDMALNAYRQSREVMLWHAANVCRVNMEYIRALQAANRLDG